MQVWHATVEPIYLLRWKLCKKTESSTTTESMDFIHCQLCHHTFKTYQLKDNVPSNTASMTVTTCNVPSISSTLSQCPFAVGRESIKPRDSQMKIYHIFTEHTCVRRTAHSSLRSASWRQ